MRRIVVALMVSAFAPLVFGQEQATIQDLSQLVGKRVVVQRMPLCRAGTSDLARSFVGKEARVISITPSPMASALKGVALDRLTPAARANLIDQQKAGTVLLEVVDGTHLDTCGPITPARASEYLKLADGETISSIATPKPLGGSEKTTATFQPHASADDSLSEAEVQAAMGGRGKDHWVTIFDMGWSAAQSAAGGSPYIALFMPEAVIAAKNEQMKRQFLSYKPTGEERKRSLTVVAQGRVGETYQEGCESVTRVVLHSSESGGVVEEAYLSEAGKEAWSNAFGATNYCQRLKVKFSLAAVERVRAAAKDGEFFMSVFAGSQKTKTYKIKRKYQTKLGLAGNRSE